MRKPVLIFALFMAVALPLFAQWQTDTRITNTTGSSYSAYNSGAWSIAADNSDVYVIWRDQTTSQYVRAHVFPIGTPPATPVSGTTIGTTSVSYDVGIAAGDNTNAHAVWDYSGSLYYNNYNGSTWGSQYIHNSGETMRAQSIANNSAGTSFIGTSGTWSYPAFVYRLRYRERTAGGVWGSMIDVWAPSSTDYHYFVHPSICLTPNGYRHISMGVYRTAGPSYTIGHSWSTNGTTWTNEYLLPANSAYHVYATSICSDKSGNLYIAYLSYPSPYQVKVLDNRGGSWNTPIQITTTSPTKYYVSICSDTFGNVWVAWDELVGSYYEIFYSMRPAGGSWSTPVQLTSSDSYNSRYPNLTADKLGNVHLCWTDIRDGNYEIYYNWYKTSGGGPGPGEDSLDLIMSQILRPGAEEDAGVAFTPKCRIWQNLEDTTIVAEVLCRIKDLATQQTVYEDILHAYPLEPEYNEVSAFKSFAPEGDKNYEAFFVVTHPDDINISNNDKNQRFTTEALAKVDAVEILAPSEEQVNTFDPEAKFVETGGKDYLGAVLHCVINNLAYADEVYNQTISHDFTANEDFTPTFPTVTELVNGPYEIRFFATDAADNPIGKDSVLIFDYTGIAENPAGGFTLDAVTPNPFVASATVSFSLGKPSEVSIKAYDVSGKLVATLATGSFDAGPSKVTWNAKDVAPGVYFIRFVTPDFNAIEKVTVLH